MAKKTLEHSFNVLLSIEDYQDLTQMAVNSRLSRSNVIRQAIRARYLMSQQAVPTCGDGTPCRVPHMHPQPARTPDGN